MINKDISEPIFCCVCGCRIGWGEDCESLRLFCEDCINKEFMEDEE